jgi:NADH:ubiquinone reductase (H+-translocating)
MQTSEALGHEEIRPPTPVTPRIPRVVIVGCGFGGLSAARVLGRSPVQVTLIDRTNHHLFQPLLYQVATSVLAPGQIAAPIREILDDQRNTTVHRAEVVGVDRTRRVVFANSPDRQRVPVPYDYLVLATGATHGYFGHEEFAPYAPGLKTLADAEELRNRILQTFEQAEAEEDIRAHADLLTFVLVGAGPTGVEMAAAIAYMVRTSLRTQFRRIDPTTARIVLLDRGPKVLGAFADELSQAAKNRLARLGVEVRLGQGVDEIDQDGVVVGGQRIASKTVIWTAGVAPSPAGRWLNAQTDRAGRVKIQPDLTVPGNPEIFVIGDTASLAQDGSPLPGVAQVALQQGRYAGEAIARRVLRKSPAAPFRYHDRGTMAVVGPGYAILQSGKLRVRSFVAWLAWALIHILSLAQPGLRLSVFLQWIWTFVSGQRGDRLIIQRRQETAAPGVEAQRPPPDARAAN